MGLASLKDLELAWLHRIMCQGASATADVLAAYANDVATGVCVFALILLAWRLVSRPPQDRVVRVLATLAIGMGIGHGLREAIWVLAPRSRPAWEYPRKEWLVGPHERMTCEAHPDLWIDRSHPPKSSAFPSAHTVTATAAAFAVFFGSRPFGVLALLYAALVGWGRLYWGKHWPSDVAGTFLYQGLISWAVWRAWPSLRERLPPRRRPPLAAPDPVT